MFDFLKRRPAPGRLTVGYPATPKLPNGALNIAEHHPVSDLPMEVSLMQFQFLPMTPMEPYEGFAEKHPEHRFVDALWLDSLLNLLAPDGKRSERIEKALLSGFYGQIFFLGTTFTTEAGPAYAFFNWSEAAPAGRYLCPIGNPVRPDLPVFAATYVE